LVSEQALTSPITNHRHFDPGRRPGIETYRVVNVRLRMYEQFRVVSHRWHVSRKTFSPLRGDQPTRADMDWSEIFCTLRLPYKNRYFERLQGLTQYLQMEEWMGTLLHGILKSNLKRFVMHWWHALAVFSLVAIGSHSHLRLRRYGYISHSPKSLLSWWKYSVLLQSKRQHPHLLPHPSKLYRLSLIGHWWHDQCPESAWRPRAVRRCSYGVFQRRSRRHGEVSELFLPAWVTMFLWVYEWAEWPFSTHWHLQKWLSFTRGPRYCIQDVRRHSSGRHARGPPTEGTYLITNQARLAVHQVCPGLDEKTAILSRVRTRGWMWPR